MTKIRTILAAAAALSAATLSTQAGAVSLAVKMACASDYYAHCSQHDPDSPGVRKCMRAVGKNLSQRCLSALVGAGLAPKTAVAQTKVAAN